MARGKGSGKKSGPKPTSKARSAKQEVRERYSKAREDAQLLGVIPTTPEGALKPERVAPEAQADAPQPNLIGEAIRKGWAVPEARKPDLVDELIRLLDDPQVSDKVKVAAFNALRQADQAQYERDHPAEAAKMRGGVINTVVSVSVESNRAAVQALREAFENDQGGGATGLPPPVEPSPFGGGRFDGEVEVGAASTEDQ